MEKFDITNLYPKIYEAKKGVYRLVEVPLLRIMALSGEGDMLGPKFRESVSALYNIAYSIKFLPKNGDKPEGYLDFTVPTLEILWSMRNSREVDMTKNHQLLWEMFVVVPGFVNQSVVNLAIQQIETKLPNSMYQDIHITTLEEKKCLQTLWSGPKDKKQSMIKDLYRKVVAKKYSPSMRYHEIYFGDPTRAGKSRIKKIIRQPVVKIKID